MQRKGFEKWISTHCKSENMRYKRDIVCRAGRVERVFQAIDPDFSFEREFAKDKGADLLNKLGSDGRALHGTGINLPIGTKQMSAIRGAAVWYMRYLDSMRSE